MDCLTRYFYLFPMGKAAGAWNWG